jgi:alpha-galactosidase
MVEQKHAEINIQSTLSRREALQDADYVIIMIEVVGLAMYEADVNMRLRYGIDQTVGDTL